MSKPLKLSCGSRAASPVRLYVIILSTLFVLTWTMVFVARVILHKHFPYNTPLMSGSVRFGDWTNFTTRVSHYGEPGMLSRNDLGLPYPYPLPSLYIFLFFVRLFHHSLRAYLVITACIFALSTLLFSLFVFARSRALLPQLAIWSTLIFGFPLFFLIDRGNIEVFIWVLVLVGTMAYLHGWKYTAAFFFALAGSMKIYPALFLLLLIPRKQYKALLFGVAVLVGISVLGIVAIQPDVKDTFAQMSASAKLLKETQIVGSDEDGLRFDHSLLAEEKQAIYTYSFFHRSANTKYPPTFERSVKFYSVFAPIAFLVIYFARLRRLPLLNQFLSLGIFSILLPYVSYEYTLVLFYLMGAVFLLYLLSRDRTEALPPPRRTNLMITCLAVIVSPLSFLILARFSGQIKGIFILVLLCTILVTPMPSELFGDFLSDTKQSQG